MGNVFPQYLDTSVYSRDPYRYHLNFLKDDQTIDKRSSFPDESPELPNGLTNVIQIAAGGAGVFALLEGGTVVPNIPLNVPEGLTNVVSIAVGELYTIALQENGMVIIWDRKGNLFSDQFDDCEGVYAGTEGAVAIRSSGTVNFWGTTNWVSRMRQMLGTNELHSLAGDYMLTKGGELLGTGITNIAALSGSGTNYFAILDQPTMNWNPLLSMDARQPGWVRAQGYKGLFAHLQEAPTSGGPWGSIQGVRFTNEVINLQLPTNRIQTSFYRIRRN